MVDLNSIYKDERSRLAVFHPLDTSSVPSTIDFYHLYTFLQEACTLPSLPRCDPQSII